MSTVTAKLYEGMFLVDSALAASDWQGVNDAITGILDRVGAEIVSVKKWDERKLAYDIRSKGRGTYILAYFRVDGPKVTEIERLASLSDQIIRVLILSGDVFEEGHMEKDTPAMAAEKAAAGDDDSPAESSDSALEDEELSDDEDSDDQQELDSDAEFETDRQ